MRKDAGKFKFSLRARLGGLDNFFIELFFRLKRAHNIDEKCFTCTQTLAVSFQYWSAVWLWASEWSRQHQLKPARRTKLCTPSWWRRWWEGWRQALRWCRKVSARNHFSLLRFCFWAAFSCQPTIESRAFGWWRWTLSWAIWPCGKRRIHIGCWFGLSHERFDRERSRRRELMLEALAALICMTSSRMWSIFHRSEAPSGPFGSSDPRSGWPWTSILSKRQTPIRSANWPRHCIEPCRACPSRSTARPEVSDIRTGRRTFPAWTPRGRCVSSRTGKSFSSSSALGRWMCCFSWRTTHRGSLWTCKLPTRWTKCRVLSSRAAGDWFAKSAEKGVKENEKCEWKMHKNFPHDLQPRDEAK